MNNEAHDINSNIQINEKDKKLFLNSKIIEENSSILEEQEEILSNIFNIIERPECYLPSVREKVLFYFPDEFLEPKDESLKFIKQDLEIYIEAYENCARTVNKITSEIICEIKKLENSKNDIEENFNILISNFNQKLLDYQNFIEISKNFENFNIQINERNNFKDEIEKFNEKVGNFSKIAENYEENCKLIYEKIAFEIKKYSEVISSITATISPLITEANRAMTLFNEVGEEIWKLSESSAENKDFSIIIAKLRTPLKNLQNKIEQEKLKIELRSKLNKNNYKTSHNKDEEENIKKIDEDEIQKNIEEKQIQLKYYSKEIKDDVNSITKKYNKINNTNIINKVINIDFKSLNNKNLTISLKKGFDEACEIGHFITKKTLILKSNVQKYLSKMSLDLLIIMDITGSMNIYLHETKTKIVSIIDKIHNLCNSNLEVRCGFIGYRDFSDKTKPGKLGYINIDFTEDYELIKNEIKDIFADGGDDEAEDVSGGFTMALKLNWISEVRYAILIADSPCHGAKYHDKEISDNYSEIDDMEKILEKMIEEKINLFVLKIKDTTDIFYEKIKVIYDKSNLTFKIEQIAKAEILADIISKTAAETYKNYKLNN